MAGTIYIERTDKKKERHERIILFFVLIVLSFLLYIAITDYMSIPNPNASECMAGFSDTGCTEGFVCKGMLLKCEETDASFKHFFTEWIFDKPTCHKEKIYREICVEKP